MKCAIRRGLGENSPESVVGGVCLDGQREIRLEMVEDGSRSEGLLEGAEGCIRLAGPDELDPFASEGGEGGGEKGVVEDELAVEVGEAQEGLDLLHRLGGRPLQDSGNFCWVHANASLRAHLSHKGHTVFVEFAFLNLGIKFMFPQDLKDATNMGHMLGRSSKKTDNVIKDADRNYSSGTLVKCNS